MQQMSREEKYEYWSLVVEEFESSDKTIREQCRANDIPFAQYYDWRKKIKEQQSESLSPSTFIEVSDESPADSSCLSDLNSSGITLDVGSNYSINVSPDFHKETLFSLLEVLRSHALYS